MTKLVAISRERPAGLAAGKAYRRWCCGQLEEGNILFFPHARPALSEEEIRFLLAQRQSDSRRHKNIAYRPSKDRLTGSAGSDAAQRAQLRGVLRRYAEWAVGFAGELLEPYREHWQVDYTTFRGQQEKGRQLRPSARNDLLHVDSFPTRPSNGNRILRIFSNLNPQQARVWNTSETFAELAPRLAGSPGLPLPQRFSAARAAAARLARGVGWSNLARSPYDRWMLSFHHFLKSNAAFQEQSPRCQWEFPPHSTWMVFTDMVSHAVLAGQFALEQTLMVSRESLVEPEKAPVNILERLAGYALTLD